MLEALLLTLRLAAWTAALLLLIGAPLGWLLARARFRGRDTLETLLLLPLVLPPTVLGFYLLLLLGEGGPLAQVGIRWAFRFEGILLGSVLFNLPFALSAYRETFRALDPELLGVARTLGAGRMRVLREVVLPLSWPGLLSGTLLAFAHTLGEFGVVLLIGGSVPGETRVVSIYLFELTQALRLEEAHRAALVMVLLSFALLYAIRKLEARWTSVTASIVR
ncbi:molybdate transport system permease protein [Deinobacterium chartae]|uniref:Molybdenum transport system permease n=1 Tax=Deinobacterium chartae TaxID=521158 RepID=A0A841I0R3_9DEIO|nr:molybdate ABC transporter permease subunit [Deinobacterium chartae]MBB6097565.1 molybdate transport system permease protein [Deinobacterium chartae]